MSELDPVIIRVSVDAGETWSYQVVQPEKINQPFHLTQTLSSRSV